MFLRETPIKQVMSQPVVTVNGRAPFSRVAALFVENRIRHLPVTDDEGRLVGLMTKRDLYHTISPRKDIEQNLEYFREKIKDVAGDFYDKESLDRYILEKVMVKDVHTLREGNTLKEALHLMVEKRIGCVVIVGNEEKVEGIITRYDLLRFMDEQES